MSPGSPALGVGELRLQSALNQTLKAEVPLVVSGEKLEDIKVTLGAPDAFAQAGIDRHQFLTSLRFHPEQRPDGSYVIQISSREPIREPFLSFLMEVSWPEGRVVKEFTVLVDPPSQVFPGLSPSRQAELSSGYRGDAAPRSLDPPDNQSSPYASRPRPTRNLSEYGPIRRRDTLSSVARAVGAEGDLTPEQLKVGIYRANPDAFIGGNVNALRYGATLNVPPQAVLAERTPAEAAREWRELQAAARRGRVDEDAGTEPEHPPANSVPSPVGTEVANRGSQLKLLAPGNKGQVGKSGGKEDIALEVAESLRQENEEIRARLGALEQQLSTLQRLLELKEQQIAGMQPAQPGTGQAGFAGAVPSPTPAAATPAPSPETVPPRAAEAAEGAAVTVAIQPPAADVVRPEEDAGNGSWIGGVGFGAVSLAAALAWWTNRRRRLFTLGLGLPSSLDALVAGKRESAGARSAPLAAARSLEAYSNLAKAVDSGEPVDPIAEADAFLANGKHAQAEQLMRAAVAAHPERDEFHLKLLEILYLGGKCQAFEELAEAVSGWRQTRPELWGEVSRMSLKLRLKSPVQADAQDTLPDAASAASIVSPSPREGMEEPALESVPAGSEDEVVPAFGEAASADGASETGGAEDIAPLEFELGGLDSAASGERLEDAQEIVHDTGNLIAYEPEPYAGAGVRTADTLESLLAELESLGDSAEKARASVPAQANPGLAFELPMAIEIEAIPVTPNSEGISGVGSGAPNEVPEDTDPYAGITDMDPLETKLDLSKAYVDMGDADSARELLEEILAAGNDHQKAEARILMERVTGLQSR
ncbi:hypothetical protein GNH96_06840 [Methylococcus geothermalis]|uniref:FimV N-terminal domain-containing protein n=2 Tax=Methylococcus geothermalis TaxID=2681310 RepID=A0A858QBQ8_9GAMM|nr:hypothetical protein GNH96_06840 [Methylococcus geothermalis]